MRCVFCRTGKVAFNICKMCGAKFCGKCDGIIEFGAFLEYWKIFDCRCKVPKIIEKPTNFVTGSYAQGTIKIPVSGIYIITNNPEIIVPLQKLPMITSKDVAKVIKEVNMKIVKSIPPKITKPEKRYR